MKTIRTITISLYTLILLILVGFFIFHQGRIYQKNSPITDAKTLEELAFDMDKRRGYKIYLPEKEGLEPYFVVKTDYLGQGNVLLLREYLLDEYMNYREDARTPYYGDSTVNNYLNDNFKDTLPKKLLNYIPKTTIPILSQEAIPGGGATEFINRNIFLLSQYELASKIKSRKLETEEPLCFFTEDRGRYKSAYLKEGITGAWWLRSASILEDAAPQLMDNLGAFTYSWTLYPAFIRPAFSLPPDLKVKKSTLDGQEVYVLSDFEELEEKDEN